MKRKKLFYDSTCQEYLRGVYEFVKKEYDLQLFLSINNSQKIHKNGQRYNGS